MARCEANATMLRDRPKTALQPQNARRFILISVSLALMATSAASALIWITTVGRISAWTGVPEYAEKLSELRYFVPWLGSLAVGLPFIAAFILGLVPEHSTTSSNVQRPAFFSDLKKWKWVRGSYLFRLTICLLGSVGFFFVLVFLSMLTDRP